MTSKSTPDHLFVYGTLRLGSSNPHAAFLHECCTHAGQGTITGRLYRIGYYPGIVLDAGGVQVLGDVFALPSDEQRAGLLQQLDHYEGVDRSEADAEYLRKPVMVNTAGGPVHCWVYLYNHPVTGKSEIPSGDFLA